MNLLWAPGMSESAKEVCRNLSGWERAYAYTLSALFGVCSFAFWLVVIGTVMGWVLGFELFPWFIVDGFSIPQAVILFVALWMIRGQSRRNLVNSQFARANGINRADIEARQPLSWFDRLVLPGCGVIVVTVVLTYMLVFS